MQSQGCLFTGVSGTVVRIGRRADAIDHWSGYRQLQSGQSQLASYDYQAVATHAGDEATCSKTETALIYRVRVRLRESVDDAGAD